MSTQMFGQILAILAACCGAFSSIMYSRISQKVDSDILAYLRMWIAFPLMALWGLVADGPAIFTAQIKDIVLMFVSGLIGFFITDMFLFRGWAIYGANETMVVMCIAPILSTVFSVIFFGETLGGIQYLGIVMTVLGIILSVSDQLNDKKKLLSYGLFCALLAATLQSSSDMLAKASISEVPYTTSAAIRAFGGLCGWIVFAVIRFRGKISTNNNLHNPKFLGVFFFTVIIGTIVGTTCSIGALKYAPAGIVTSLKQMSPVLILPYDFFVLKKHSVSAVLGTLIAVTGVILFFI